MLTLYRRVMFALGVCQNRQLVPTDIGHEGERESGGGAGLRRMASAERRPADAVGDGVADLTSRVDVSVSVGVREYGHGRRGSHGNWKLAMCALPGWNHPSCTLTAIHACEMGSTNSLMYACGYPRAGVSMPP